ncbi:MAG: hypothetical protein BIFFINMI_03068 [Phycisphaerae bacterium]|nr:hypothetical protein [Phycisphaerae bacterium]
MQDLHTRWIEKLASMVDMDRLFTSRERWRRMYDFKPEDALPRFDRAGQDKLGPSDWPTYLYNDAFNDPEKMLMNELAGVYAAVRLGDDRPLNIRANYGTVILPSVFGAPWQLTDNSMPWAHHFEGGADAIRRLIDAGPPDPADGLGARCVETADFYRQVLADYPPLAGAIDIYHPDLQGPYDVAHLLMGPDIFMAGYDQPELVDELLELVTETYRRFILMWADRVGFNDGDGLTTHWTFYVKGWLMIRDDTAILLRPEQYRRFVLPYDSRLLAEFGGAIHFCGRADHLFEEMLATENLSAVHSSQPALNDHARLIRLAQERKIALLAWPSDAVPPGTTTGLCVMDRQLAKSG